MRFRKCIRWSRRLFSAPLKMRRVPQEPVFGTEYLFRTVEACFLHRMLPKMRRVPQEAFLSTARIFRTVEACLWYRVLSQRHFSRPHCITLTIKGIPIFDVSKVGDGIAFLPREFVPQIQAQFLEKTASLRISILQGVDVVSKFPVAGPYACLLSGV